MKEYDVRKWANEYIMGTSPCKWQRLVVIGESSLRKKYVCLALCRCQLFLAWFSFMLNCHRLYMRTRTELPEHQYRAIPRWHLSIILRG